MKIDVIIPALNEEQAISFVLQEIPKNLVRTIYVCDNGSTDNTVSIAANKGANVLSETKKGYGSACLKGLEALKRLPSSDQPDIVVFLDADYSDYPLDMIPMIAYLQQKDLDLVIGSRVLGQPEKGSLTGVQRFGNWLATFLIRILYNTRYTDLGPFRAIKYSSLLQLDMKDRNYGWTVEMQVKAAKLKMKIGEVPVRYKKRIGISKVSGTLQGVIMAGYKIIITIFRHS